MARFVAAVVLLPGICAACGSFGASPDPAGGDAAAPPGDAAAAPLSDGGTEAGASCEGRTDLLLCETFDSPDFAARGWTRSVGAGSVEIDEARALSGGSLRASLVADVTNKGAYWRREALAAGATHFRVHAFLEKAVPDPGPYPFLVLSGLELNVYGGKIALNQFVSPTVFETSGRPFPLGKWFCIEWMISAGESVVWIDGVEEIRHAETFQQPQKLEIGFEYNATTTAPATVWFDELAVGTARIGCD